MYTISDYIRWRGDVPFSVSPFNTVDGYILAKAGTPDLTGLISEEEGEILLSEAITRYSVTHGEGGDKLGALASPGIMPMLRSLASTARFGGVRILKYVNVLDEGETEQFSALTLFPGDGTAFVTFRGTDDSLLAWKENMYLASRQSLAAQRDALEYLEDIAEKTNLPLRVGGHSKGGNLAVYAASKTTEELQDRIIEVINFDGPGFRAPFLDDPGYNRILPKVRSILPEYSYVGTLLYRKEKPEYVACTRTGFMAHDGLCWSAQADGFESVSDLQSFSESYQRAMRRTLIPMSPEQRLAFADAIFDILTASGAETVTDLTEQGLKRTAGMVYSLIQDGETRGFVSEFLENLLGEISRSGAAAEPKSLAGVILSGVGKVIGK